MGRQIPFLTSRDTFRLEGCHVSRGCHLWVVRYLHWQHATHSALTIVTYQWIVRDQGVVKVCVSSGWTCQLRTRRDELLIWLPWSIWESVLHIWLHMYLMDGHVLSSVFIPTDGWSYWRFSNWVPQTFTYSPLMHPYMERTCTPRPNTLLHAHVFPIWEEKPKISGP